MDGETKVWEALGLEESPIDTMKALRREFGYGLTLCKILAEDHAPMTGGELVRRIRFGLIAPPSEEDAASEEERRKRARALERRRKTEAAKKEEDAAAAKTEAAKVVPLNERRTRRRRRET